MCKLSLTTCGGPHGPAWCLTQWEVRLGNRLGLPTSSSQCIVGGIVGVGLLEGVSRGVNWFQFGKQFASWVATLFIVGFGVAAVFAQAVYAPSVIDGRQINVYEDRIFNTTSNLYSNFNKTLLAMKAGANDDVYNQLNAMQWVNLNDTLTAAANANQKWKGKDVSSFVRASVPLDNLNRALNLYELNTVFTLGQNRVFPGAEVCNAVPSNTTAAASTLVPCVSPKLVPADKAVPFKPA
eukprot:jgi/Botrbrau1/18252/Bobra.0634s0005.1